MFTFFLGVCYGVLAYILSEEIRASRERKRQAKLRAERQAARDAEFARIMAEHDTRMAEHDARMAAIKEARDRRIALVAELRDRGVVPLDENLVQALRRAAEEAPGATLTN